MILNLGPVPEPRVVLLGVFTAWKWDKDRLKPIFETDRQGGLGGNYREGLPRLKDHRLKEGAFSAIKHGLQLSTHRTEFESPGWRQCA